MPVRHVDDALLTAPGERGALVRRLHAGGRGVSPTETEGLPTPVRVPGASNLGRARIRFPRRRTSCVLCYPCLCGRHTASSGPPWVCEATWTPSGHVILTHLLSFEWGRDQETGPGPRDSSATNRSGLPSKLPCHLGRIVQQNRWTVSGASGGAVWKAPLGESQRDGRSPFLPSSYSPLESS